MSDLDRYKDVINHADHEPGDELSDFLRKASDAQLPKSSNKEAIWNNISAAIDDTQESRSNGTRVWRMVGIAAAIALIATFSVIFFTGSNPETIQVITQAGESRVELLPDGSKVNLNSSSSISYAEDWNREIILEGEAFFEVTEGEKFVVRTRLGDVEVLGTSFNVFARDSDFEVSCKTGKVRVSVPKRVVREDLTPGQAITVNTDTVKVVFRVPESIGTWRSGEFYFEDEPIGDVFEEFERQFSIEIEHDFENQDVLLFSGYFRNDAGAENALEAVCAVMELQFQQTGPNKFTIRESSQ